MLEKQAIKLVQPSKDQFLSTLFLVTKKDAGYRPVINLKKVEPVHPIRTLQNGRYISFETSSPEERLYVQDRLKGRLFCSSPSFKLPEIYQVQRERESLLVSMPLLWPKFSSKSIHKTNEDSDFRHAEIECGTDNTSRRYFDNAINKKELLQARDTLLFLLQTLGLLVNKNKSVLHSCQILQFLGV